MNGKKILPSVALILILLGGFSVRLYKINSPIADWHSWRQADTAAVARNFIKFGFTPLHPRFDDLSNVPSGKDNPNGYRMVEFPFYQSIGFTFYQLFSGFSIEIWLRLVSIFFSFASMVFLYLLVGKYINKLTALISAAVFSFLPYAIYYSRAILPEMTAAGLVLGAIFFLDKAVEKKRFLLLIISGVLSALALLVKPPAAFLLLPIIYLLVRQSGIRAFLTPSLYLYGFITLVPLILWRWWINQYPEGIPAWSWLLNGGNIRFTGAFFRWILAERLGKLILGYAGLVFFFLGTILKPNKKEGWLFWSLLFGTVLYIVVFARGNVQHDYYQVLILPVVSVFVAKGFGFFLTVPSEYFSKIVSIILGLALFVVMLAFSWYEVRGYFWINHPEIVEAGKVVDKLVPKDAKVIAPYGGDTAFLYQTKRAGWPVMEKSLPEMMKMGAGILVIVNPDQDALNLDKTYKVIGRSEKYIIFDLKKS